MQHGIRFVCIEQLDHKLTIREISLNEAEVLDGGKPFPWLLDLGCGDASGLFDPLTPRKVINTDDSFIKPIR
jgi:hypothetical protein